MRSRPPPRDFGTGELDPRLDGIANEITARGARTLENWIVRKTGSAIRRPGTFFAREVKDSNDATIAVAVEIDTDNIFILEIGDAYIRFFQQSTHAVVGAPYEVTSPWSTGELSQLRYQYIPDEQAIYWTHPWHAMRKLAFTSAADWSLSRAGILTSPQVIVGSLYGRMAITDDLKTWDVHGLGLEQADGARSLLGGHRGYGNGLYAIADNNDILVSTDGQNWVAVTPSSMADVNSLAVNRYGEILAVGAQPDGIFLSRDNGLSWYHATSPTSTTNWNVSAYNDSQEAWRIVGQNADARSTNGGITWTSATVQASLNVVGSDIATDGTDLWVIVNVSGGRILRSTSIAAPWQVAQSTGGDMRGVAYGLQEGNPLWVAVGTNGLVFQASGSAATWATVTAFTSNSLFVVRWIADKFYAFGRGGVYWTSETGTSWTTHTDATFPAATGAGNDIYLAIVPLIYQADTFGEVGNYARDLTFYEQRLVIGPTANKPSSVWGSKTGRFQNFGLGVLANEAFSYSLTGDRNVDIQWLVGGNELVVGTRTEEIVLRGQAGLGITPNGVQALKQSTFGSDAIKPVRIHNTIVFVQRGGEVIRGYVPGAGTDAWQSPDLTYHAGHITEGGVIQLAHQDDPQTILYAVRDDGVLLALTYHPPNVLAWSRIVTDGEFESVAVVPTSGAEDEIWAVVKRTVNSVTKRYVEYFSTLNVASLTSAHYLDCGVSLTAGATFATMGSLTHLAGETVDVLLDGNEWLTGLTVAASGTISFTAGYSGTTAHAGLPYTSKLQTMRSDYGSGYGSGAGLNRKTSNVLLWVHDSLGGFIGPTETLATEAIIVLSSTATLETDVMYANFSGGFDRDNYHWLKVTQPTPFELVGMLPDVETGDR